jgi:DNA-binding GntR family transcriptional regulator
MATSTASVSNPGGHPGSPEGTLPDAAPLRSVGQHRETLADLAYKELLEAIELGRLEAGQPLGLDQLARQLGMSRTPVNLALSRLHAEGVVSYSGRLGFYVRALTADEVRDMYDLRLMCELHAVATGLPGATASHIDEIASIQQGIAAHTDWAEQRAFRRFWEMDGQFHRQIVRLSPNEQLQEWFGRLSYHVHGARLALRTPQADAFAAMLHEHAAIVDALQQRDAPVAQQALRQHITRSRDVTLARLSAGQP